MQVVRRPKKTLRHRQFSHRLRYRKPFYIRSNPADVPRPRVHGARGQCLCVLPRGKIGCCASGNQRRAQFLSRPVALEPNFKVGQSAPEYRLNANDLRQAVTKEEQLDDREELRST